MEYIVLDIDGILTGTIVTDLELSEQTMWFRLLGVAAKGHGRIGYVERAEGVGFSREALYVELRCYKEEDKRVADHTIEVCLGGDDPRIKMLDNNVIEILKWDKYQFIPKGSTRDTVAERRLREPKRGNVNWKPEPCSQTIQDAKDKKKAAVLTVEQEQTVVDQLNEQGKMVVDKETGEKILTSKEKEGE